MDIFTADSLLKATNNNNNNNPHFKNSLGDLNVDQNKNPPNPPTPLNPPNPPSPLNPPNPCPHPPNPRFKDSPNILRFKNAHDLKIPQSIIIYL